MPYKPDGSDAPDYVDGEKKRKQWAAVWNTAYDKAKADGKSKEDAESSAFAQANVVAGPNVEKAMPITYHPTFRKCTPLIKVDSINHTVTGVITSECPDKTDEICDYASSKPYYQEWSDEIAKATNGASLGNVREMHDLKAVGKLIQLNFDDENKQITGTTKVIDPLTWEKCETGVLSGYSQGGEYIGEMKKEGKYNRYTAKPAEVSLVDNPCNPDAHFEYVKADGSIEMRKFQSSTMTPTLGFGEQSQASASPTFDVTQNQPKKPSPDEDDEEVTSMKKEELQELIRAGVAAALGKADAKAADDKDDKKPYGDVDYADPGYQEDKQKRYPLDTEKHIRAAWTYINMPKNATQYKDDEVGKIKDKIVAAWKEKIDKDGPPSAEKVAKAVLTILHNAIAKKSSAANLTKSELSFDALSSLVNAALRTKFGLDSEGYSKYWIRELFPDKVVISDCEDGKLYSVSYTVSGTTAEIGDDKTEVTTDYVAAGVEKATTAQLTKGMNTLRTLADLLLQFAWLKWDVTNEQEREGDKDSPLPKALQDDLAGMADTLVSLASEETKELVTQAASGEAPHECSQTVANYGPCCCAAPLVLMDVAGVQLEKAFVSEEEEQIATEALKTVFMDVDGIQLEKATLTSQEESQPYSGYEGQDPTNADDILTQLNILHATM